MTPSLRLSTCLYILCIIHHKAFAFSVMQNNDDDDDAKTMGRLMIVGFGRVGQAVAQLLLLDNDKDNTTRSFMLPIMATTRRLTDCQIDNDQRKVQYIPYTHAADYLESCSHVLLAMPLDAIDRTLLDDMIAAAAAPAIRWIGVISTTSVYGNHNGAWVDETSDVRLSSSNGKPSQFRRVETFLLDQNGGSDRHDRAVCVFRCAGIYGGQQSALHTVWKQGTTATATSTTPQDDVTNRIHVDDVAAAVVAGIHQHGSGIYNLADDEPASRTVVLQYARQLLDGMGVVSSSSSVRANNDGNTDTTATGSTAPGSSSSSTTSARSRRRQSDQKRVCNRRMRQDLLPQLQYPTYREGLQAILQDPANPWWTSNNKL